jgi:hypothetical protein
MAVSLKKFGYPLAQRMATLIKIFILESHQLRIIGTKITRAVENNAERCCLKVVSTSIFRAWQKKFSMAEIHKMLVRNFNDRDRRH